MARPRNNKARDRYFEKFVKDREKLEQKRLKKAASAAKR
jgi:hypothetical protein